MTLHLFYPRYVVGRGPDVPAPSCGVRTGERALTLADVTCRRCLARLRRDRLTDDQKALLGAPGD